MLVPIESTYMTPVAPDRPCWSQQAHRP